MLFSLFFESTDILKSKLIVAYSKKMEYSGFFLANSLEWQDTALSLCRKARPKTFFQSLRSVESDTDLRSSATVVVTMSESFGILSVVLRHRISKRRVRYCSLFDQSALGRFPSETTNVPKIRKRRKRSKTMVIVTSKLIVSTLEHQRKRERTKESSSTIDEKPLTHKVSPWIFAGPPAETKGIYLLTYVE